MINTVEEIRKYFEKVDSFKDTAKVPRDLIDVAILYELIKLNDNISNLKEKKTTKSGE
jgi:hypothetical protein